MSERDDVLEALAAAQRSCFTEDRVFGQSYIPASEPRRTLREAIQAMEKAKSFIQTEKK